MVLIINFRQILWYFIALDSFNVAPHLSDIRWLVVTLHLRNNSHHLQETVRSDCYICSYYEYLQRLDHEYNHLGDNLLLKTNGLSAALGSRGEMVLLGSV